MVFVHSAVGNYKDISSVFIGAVTLNKQVVKRPFKRSIFVVEQRNCLNLKAGAVDCLNLYKLLTDSVDRRVCNLCEKLFKIVKEGLMLFRKHRKGNIGTHSGGSLSAVFSHRNYSVPYILIGVTECLVKAVSCLLVVPLNAAVGHFKLVKPYEVLVKPLAVGLSCSVIFFTFLVGYNALISGINKQHFARF